MIRFIERGPATQLQDLGRIGQQSLGISVSGAMDPLSHRLANALLGNEDGAPALEFALLGPTLEVTQPLSVAIIGDCAPKVNGEPIGSNRSLTLQPGQRLQIGALKSGRYGTLAFAGWPAFAPSLGSYATHARTGVGGFEGDTLELTECRTTPDLEVDVPSDDNNAFEFIPGPQDDFFTAEELGRFCAQDYKVDALSDRMGYRLSGPPLSHRADKGANIISDGISLGSIQVPANGQPIVLMADRHTMGGYPKIGTVCSVDMGRLAQRRPGSTVRFRAISAAEGVQRRRSFEAEIVQRIGSIRPVCQTWQPTTATLLGKNLISGVLSA